MNTYRVYNTSGSIDFGNMQCDATLPSTGSREERRAECLKNKKLVACLTDMISTHVGFRVRVFQITPQRHENNLFVGYTQDLSVPAPKSQAQVVKAEPKAEAPKGTSTRKTTRGLSRNAKVVSTMLKNLDASERSAVLALAR